MIKYIFCLLSCLFISVICFSQPVSLNQGGTKAVNYYEELPYETINGKLLVYVEIAGHKRKFLFDTGAPMQLSKELAATLGAPVLNENLVRDVNGNLAPTQVIKLDEIKLGTLIFNGVPAIGTFPEFYKCWGIDGVVGSNIIRNSIVSIDNERHIIILTDQPGKLSLNAKHSAPLIANTDLQSTPVIQIMLKNKLNLTIPFDTGDNGFLRFSDDLMDRISENKVFSVIAKGYGAQVVGELGLQADADKYRLKFPFLTIGNARFDNVITETIKGGIPGIGTKLLDYGVVTLDFINGKFYFDPRSEKTTDLNEKQWPFQPVIKGDKLLIGLVWQKGANLVKPGEQLMAVDDRDLSKVNLCDMISNKPILFGKESATVTIKDEQGNLRKVQISKE